MTRLQAEWHRLYLPHAPADAPASHAANHAGLIDAEGRTRAMVLALARPADWAALSALWQAVQAKLALPAPAIAVSGVDAYQLWFSMAEPVPIREAQGFLATLRERYLGTLAPERIALLPALDAGSPTAASVRHVDALPPQQVQADQWSAFLAPDLAPMFAETPWLDMPPSPDGQAELLSRLQTIQPEAWHTALARLRQPDEGQTAPPPSGASSMTWPGSAINGAYQDPRCFLLDVMNDASVALALRIEAAKALLCAPGSGRPEDRT